jgi:hypothetical protein
VVLKLIAIKGGNWVPGIDTLRFWHRYLLIQKLGISAKPVRKAKFANLAPNPRPKAGKPHLNPRLALKSARRFPLGPLALMEVALE